MPFDFKPTVDALDAVPEPFRGLYVPVEGGSGFAYHPEFKGHVHGLTSALDKERKTAKDLKNANAAWAALGETPEAVQAKLKEFEEQLAKSGDGKTNWDKMKADLESGFAKKLEGKDKELAEARTTVERYLVDNEATVALTEAKGTVKLLLPHVKASVKVFVENGQHVVRVVDKDGDPRGDGKGGFMTIRDLVSEMKSSEDFGRAFESSGNTGGGKPAGGGGGKPNAGKPNRADMSPLEKIKAGLAARNK